MLCLFLAGPWVDRDAEVYRIAGAMMLIGVALWAVTLLINRLTGTDTGKLEELSDKVE